MKRAFIALCLSVLASMPVQAAEFSPARILEAEAYTEHQTIGAVIKGNGTIQSPRHDMNRITVSLQGMKITGIFESHWSWSVKASNLVIGTEVKAMVEKDKLIVLTPEGKTIKARIVRRERESGVQRSEPHSLAIGHTTGDGVEKANLGAEVQ